MRRSHHAIEREVMIALALRREQLPLAVRYALFAKLRNTSSSAFICHARGTSRRSAMSQPRGNLDRAPADSVPSQGELRQRGRPHLIELSLRSGAALIRVDDRAVLPLRVAHPAAKLGQVISESTTKPSVARPWPRRRSSHPSRSSDRAARRLYRSPPRSCAAWRASGCLLQSVVGLALWLDYGGAGPPRPSSPRGPPHLAPSEL